MAGCSRIFRFGEAVPRSQDRRQLNEDGDAREHARASRCLPAPFPYVTTGALSALLLLAAAVEPVFAAPKLDRVSGLDCVLTSEDSEGNASTVNDLLADLAAAGMPGDSPETPEIAFVVIYSLNHDNDGQPVRVTGTNGFTGPVICVNSDVVGIAETTQTTDIPAPGTASSVTTLDAEDAFILRYRLNGPPNDGVIEKVICHSTNDNTDCFRISPLIP